MSLLKSTTSLIICICIFLKYINHLVKQCETDSLWIFSICDDYSTQIVISHIHMAQVLWREKKRSKLCCYQNNVHPILLYRKTTVSTGALKKGQRIKSLIKIQLSKMFSIRLPKQKQTNITHSLWSITP